MSLLRASDTTTTTTTNEYASLQVKFKKPVVPGDTLVMEVELTKYRAKFGIAKATGRAYVDGQLAVVVDSMTFAIAK